MERLLCKCWIVRWILWLYNFILCFYFNKIETRFWDLFYFLWLCSVSIGLITLLLFSITIFVLTVILYKRWIKISKRIFIVSILTFIILLATFVGVNMNMTISLQDCFMKQVCIQIFTKIKVTTVKQSCY